MSHFARASIHKAVISYDKKYKTSDFEMVTLRQIPLDGRRDTLAERSEAGVLQTEAGDIDRT